MRIGIMIGGTPGVSAGLDETLATIEQAERDGLDTIWMANIFTFDATMTLALAGARTSRIELGTFVVPTYPRHPAALAQQALTASAASGGRFTLGIGISHKVVIENMFGLDYSKPVRHMREYLAVLNPLLAGEVCRFQGEEYRVAAQLSVPGAAKPDVIVAALGPQMLKLSGQHADGTGTWMGGPAYLREVAIPTICAAASDSGRRAPRIVAGFPIAVTPRAAEARATAAKTFANYGQLPSYRATLDRGGYGGPADVAIVGSENEVEARLNELAAIGVTDFNAATFPVEEDPGVVARTTAFLAALARARK